MTQCRTRLPHWEKKKTYKKSPQQNTKKVILKQQVSSVLSTSRVAAMQGGKHSNLIGAHRWMAFFKHVSTQECKKHQHKKKKNMQSMSHHVKLWMFVPVSEWFFWLVFVGVFRGIFCFVLLFLLGFFPGLTLFGIGKASVFSINLKRWGVCMGGLTKALT